MLFECCTTFRATNDTFKAYNNILDYHKYIQLNNSSMISSCFCTTNIDLASLVGAYVWVAASIATTSALLKASGSDSARMPS
jgi:hypothetical protein